MSSDIFRIILASKTEEETLILRRRIEPLLKAAEANQSLRSSSSAEPPTAAGSRASSTLGIRPMGWIQFQSTPPSALIHLAERATVQDAQSLIVYNCSERLTQPDVDVLVALRNHGHRGPLLVLSRVEVEASLRNKVGRSGTGYLLKPFEGSEFIGLCRKLLVCGSVEHQAHRRFATAERVKARFARDAEPERWGVVRNLSRGGAFVAFERQPVARVGDPVALALELGQLRKTWEVDGRVVWITNTGCGVEFTGAPSTKPSPAHF